MIYNSDCPHRDGYNSIDKKVSEMGRLLGRLVREARLERNLGGKPLSIRQLADRLGVHHSYLSRIERGDDVCLKPDKLLKLADLLGMDHHLVLAVAGIVPERLREAIFDNRKAFTSFVRNVLRDDPSPCIRDVHAEDRARRCWRIAYADDADLLLRLADAMSREGWIVSRRALDHLAAALALAEPSFCDVGLGRGVVNTAGMRSLRIFRRHDAGGKGRLAVVYRSRRTGTGTVRTVVDLFRRMRHAFGVRVQVTDGFDVVVFDSCADREAAREDAGPFRPFGGNGGFPLQAGARNCPVPVDGGDAPHGGLTTPVLSVCMCFQWDEMDAFSVFVDAGKGFAQPVTKE
ncbi:helix-turn-helix domain-containing protein [Nitratidesulfovibrio sp. HK-II]|uniref:helix-turn-helix domain-containing protein n=1 Tax=Nitratidesulfovibrio sp. HK-II TaxID=2009266 RepID=UPI000E2E9EA9